MIEKEENVKSEDNIFLSGNFLRGSLLFLHPAKVVPAGWQENYELCDEYLKRFGVAVALPFWFVNSMDKAITLLQEALDKGHRRWILECGPWAGNPPIEEFRELIISAGHSLDTISLAATANIWLDPVEWLEVAAPKITL